MKFTQTSGQCSLGRENDDRGHFYDLRAQLDITGTVLILTVVKDGLYMEPKSIPLDLLFSLNEKIILALSKQEKSQ